MNRKYLIKAILVKALLGLMPVTFCFGVWSILFFSMIPPLGANTIIVITLISIMFYSCLYAIYIFNLYLYDRGYTSDCQVFLISLLSLISLAELTKYISFVLKNYMGWAGELLLFNTIFFLIFFSSFWLLPLFLIIIYIQEEFFGFSIQKVLKTIKNNPEASSEHIDSLLNIIIENNNKIHSHYATSFFTTLSSAQAIDLLCQRWAETRDDCLTQILLETSFVATQPDNIRVLTALKVNKIEIVINQNPKLVKWLLASFEDKDLDIASRAKKYAICLTNQSVIDELFWLS